jgi:hypothetical protein
MSADGSARPSRITARLIQTALGTLWLLDGLLQLQPKLLGPSFAHDVIGPSAMRQPAFVAQAITHVAHLISIQPALVDVLFAGVQILIGIGLLIRETVRPALVISIGWALGVWVLGEGMGGLLTGSALPLTGAPGAALLYAVVAVLVWPTSTSRSDRAAIRSGPAGSSAAEGPLGPWAGRIAWAVCWSGMAVLWLLPSGRSSGAIPAAINGAASGEPSWLGHLELSASHAVDPVGSSLAVTVGVLSLVIGLGPLLFRRYAAFLVAGVALSLDFWLFGQAFGQMFTGIGTDPSTGPLVILLALAIAPAPTIPAALSPDVSTPPWGDARITPRVLVGSSPGG